MFYVSFEIIMLYLEKQNKTRKNTIEQIKQNKTEH